MFVTFQSVPSMTGKKMYSVLMSSGLIPKPYQTLHHSPFNKTEKKSVLKLTHVAGGGTRL